MTIDQVADILRQVITGELTLEQIEHIRTFLLAGIDITSLMV